MESWLFSADAPLIAFHDNVIRTLKFDLLPARVTHVNDISIHFQTFKDEGVIFATSNAANNDYIKAYIHEGHVYVETFIERSGSEVYCSLEVLYTLVTCLSELRLFEPFSL